MKTIQIPSLTLLLAIALPVHAASLPGHMGDRSLIETRQMPRVSIGAGLELIKRDIVIGNTIDGTIDGNAYSAYLGVDALSWLTIHGTAGAMFLNSLDFSDAGDNFDAGLRWSLGLNASLWHIDTTTPDFMRGRFAIGFTAEYADTTAAAGDTGDVTWTETAMALPFSFEMPNEPMEFWGVESLLIYAGPVYTVIDGDIDGTGLDFEESQDAGALFGADVYFAPNVSLGARIIYIDDATVGVSARYHF
ncbi:MAG: hypothetical protein O3B24_10535 [Verrucomicrobia bacterium]|nr:hypothetical protein [Verrucomicrobiota bacterium]